MKPIVLATINARYFHTSLGLRCLRANLGSWRDSALIKEFILQHRPVDMVEEILASDPWVVGLGVYIWNVELMRDVVRILKSVRPDLPVVLGGPELIHPPEWPDFAALADVVVVGDGEHVLPRVLDELAQRAHSLTACPEQRRGVVAQTHPAPTHLTPTHLTASAMSVPSAFCAPTVREGVSDPDLSTVLLPDGEYTDEDLAHRLVYVEASRGCSFHCEFCLSARESTVRRFDPDAVLASLDRLWKRGARQFKFVDRALHLGGVSPKILEFFLQRLDAKTFLHFEVVPEAIPGWAWPLLAQFPEGQLQLEAGVQSLDPGTCAEIGRPQNPERVLAALRRLRTETHAHLHTDLVLGLPGDTLDSIQNTFDLLLSVEPHEIQVGILKRLRGAPIMRHDARHDMRYSASSPYEILATSTLDFPTMQRLKRFSRYFDLVFNSGNFASTAKAILQGDSAFASFLDFSDWLHAQTGQTAGIALDRLGDLLHRYLVTMRAMDGEQALGLLTQDFRRAGRALPGMLTRHAAPGSAGTDAGPPLPRRQRRHHT